MVVQGRTPTNISMKWEKTATRRTEWGGEVMKLEAELLQEKEEIGGTNPHMAYELKRTNSPAARSRGGGGILPALILLA
jgi:hypothetical protein